MKYLRIIVYYRSFLYICHMNKNKVYDYLSAAEHGDVKAQNCLCQLFFDDEKLSLAMSNDFWREVDIIAQEGKDYANFIMHCRYFGNSEHNTLSYYYIRKAIRHKDVPLAFLRLGFLYAMGIGTRANFDLSKYFYDMALALGCKEAESYIEEDYISGRRSIVNEVKKTIAINANPSQEKIAYLKKLVERERRKKNYGNLSRIRDYLSLFYPDYNQEKAYDDIINDCLSIDADICYSLSNIDNGSEFNIDILEDMLNQLFAPITQDNDLYQSILNYDFIGLYSEGESELLQCIVNLRSSYSSICTKNKMTQKELAYPDPVDILPYFKPSLMALLRRQAFRCILAIRETDPHISDFLNSLDSDEKALNVCEEVSDQDVQLFLISYVELNIDIDSLLITLQDMLKALRNQDLAPLAKYLNEFIDRVTHADIEHKLPKYNSENLPKIELV